MTDQERIYRCMARQSDLSSPHHLDLLFRLHREIQEKGELNHFQRKALHGIESRLVEGDDAQR